MKSESNRSIPSQVILGGFVMLMGVLFLLDNLDIYDFSRLSRFIPGAILLTLGLIKLLDTRSSNGALVGSLLLLAGASLTLGRLGLFNLNGRTVWPLVLIVVGAAVVYKAVAGRRMMTVSDKDHDGANTDDALVDMTAILGGFDRRITTPAFRGGEITAVMGGCVLDLRGSSIEGEAVLNVFTLMGGITLKVPPDWTVILTGTPIMGGFDEKTIPAPHNTKRLVVRGYAIMGGVEVRN